MRQELERWRQVFHSAGWGVAIASADLARFESVNPAFARMHGYTETELNGQPLGLLLNASQLEILAARTPPPGAEGREVFEFMHTHKDGHRFPVRIDRAPARDAQGHILFWFAQVTDLTGQSRAEAALLRQKAELEAVLNLVPAQIWIKDTGNRFLRVNRQVCRDLGLGPEQIEGHTAEELFPAMARAYFEDDQEVFRTGRPKLGILEQIVTAKGEPRWVRTDKLPIPGEHGAIVGLMAFVQDITEEKRLQTEGRRMEQEILHAQKVESLGHLAGGLAHDMNNVLAAILGVTSALQAQYAADPFLAKALETILHAGNRGRDLVRGLTSFARKELGEPRLLDLNEVVRQELELLRRTTQPRYDLVMDLEESLGPVMGEPSAIGNILMNLCVNAVSAMPQGGTVAFGTRTLATGLVELSVSDTGEGMSGEVLRRAFEPFFTTKPRGEGTGLGLTIVHSTMKAHHGSMELRSAPGEGTTVLLRFPPAAPAAPCPDPAAGAPGAAAPSRPLAVLLVDDDELIRATAPLMLEHMGHRVAVAARGQEAVAALESGMEADLVVLDQNMPGLSGIETLVRIRALRPELPVILSTGRADAALDALLRGHSRLWLLLKPYSFTELRERLREIFP